MSDIAVIGAGASGLTAAVFAARMGATVTVYEKNERIAKKLLATGNGRCNLTNINTKTSRYHGDKADFCAYALESFGVSEAISFFEEMGLLTRVEDEGKVFPYCGRASAVLDVFRMEAERLGVVFQCGFDVKEVIKRKSCFEIVSWDGRHEFSAKVIFSAGGKASPDLGGGGSGYDIGNAAIRAALCAEDKSGKETLIRNYVLEKTGFANALDNISYFYSIGKSGVASFSPTVFKAYDEGDEVAAEILEKNMNHIAHLASTTLKYFPESACPIKIAVVGGLTKRWEMLYPMIEDAMKKNGSFGKVKLEVFDGDVVVGALLRAGAPIKG